MDACTPTAEKLVDSLTVTAAQGTPRGSYPFTVVASDGAITTQLAATLGISGFSLSLCPSSQIAFPGQGASYTSRSLPCMGGAKGYGSLAR